MSRLMPDTQTYRCPNAMAICADDLTFRDLPLSLSDALRIADVELLACLDMIEVKRDGMRAISAIGAPVLDLVSIQPIANARRPLIGLFIDHLPIAGLRKSFFTPSLHLLWALVSRWTGAVAALYRAISCWALGLKPRTTDDTSEWLRRYIFPRWHLHRMPQMFYPCKDAIFQATYDLVEED